MSAVDVPPASVAAGTCSVRRAAAGDRPALERMLARCTGQTRYRRFHGPVSVFPERYLTEALSGSPLHFALVACLGDDAEGDGTVVDGTVVDGTVVALASCRAVDEGVAELGILVEDEWQRRGVGSDLLLRDRGVRRQDRAARAAGAGARGPAVDRGAAAPPRHLPGGGCGPGAARDAVAAPVIAVRAAPSR